MSKISNFLPSLNRLYTNPNEITLRYKSVNSSLITIYKTWLSNTIYDLFVFLKKDSYEMTNCSALVYPHISIIYRYVSVLVYNMCVYY